MDVDPTPTLNPWVGLEKRLHDVVRELHPSCVISDEAPAGMKEFGCGSAYSDNFEEATWTSINDYEVQRFRTYMELMDSVVAVSRIMQTGRKCFAHEAWCEKPWASYWQIRFWGVYQHKGPITPPPNGRIPERFIVANNLRMQLESSQTSGRSAKRA